MKYAFVKPLRVLAIAFAIVTGACDLVYKNVPFVQIPPQQVSGPVVISDEWIEIVPPNPLRPSGEGQVISVKYTGYAKAEKADDKIWSEDRTTLYLADGRQTKIEAYLFDDKGESYELRIGGVIRGFDLSTSSVSVIRNGESVEIKKAQPFSQERTYVKLRIRSQIPLECEGIDWVSGKMY